MFVLIGVNVQYVFLQSFVFSVLGSWPVGWSVNPTILGIPLKLPKPMEPVEYRDFCSSLDFLPPFPLTAPWRLFIFAW